MWLVCDLVVMCVHFSTFPDSIEFMHVHKGRHTMSVRFSLHVYDKVRVSTGWLKTHIVLKSLFSHVCDAHQNDSIYFLMLAFLYGHRYFFKRSVPVLIVGIERGSVETL